MKLSVVTRHGKRHCDHPSTPLLTSACRSRAPFDARPAHALSLSRSLRPVRAGNHRARRDPQQQRRVVGRRRSSTPRCTLGRSYCAEEPRHSSGRQAECRAETAPEAQGAAIVKCLRCRQQRCPQSKQGGDAGINGPSAQMEQRSQMQVCPRINMPADAAA